MTTCLKYLLSLLISLTIGIRLVAASGANFSNPVFRHDWPDPCVWQGDDGRFYSFSTSGSTYHYEGGQFLCSPDMCQWDTVPDFCFELETKKKLHEYGSHIWAPQVVKINGKWLMYLTCYESAAKSSIHVLSFDSPSFPAADGRCGPWTYENILQSSEWGNKIKDTIDPFVVQDPSTGKVWLFYGSTGKEFRIELSADGLAVAQGANAQHVAGTADTGNSREKVFEGPYLYHRDNYWYYFCSSGWYGDGTYALRVGRAASLKGLFTDRIGGMMTEGKAEKILTTESGSAFSGPGHNGEIFEDAQGNTYMFYHSHYTGVSKEDRPLMLQQIYWDAEGWPYFANEGHPLATEQRPNLDYTYTLEIKDSEWATVYVPYRFEVPSSMEVYRVNVNSQGWIEKQPITEPIANCPYLVHAPKGKYTLHGVKTHEAEGLRCGDLIGVHGSQMAPKGAYVLQKHGNRVGFYQLGEAREVKDHRAYLVLPASVQHAAPACYDLDDEEAGIEHIAYDEEAAALSRYFGLDGMPLREAPASQPYLRRTADGKVLKCLVR